MRFRTGLLIGLGAGYVLGAKAGRERYEQIQAAWQRFRGDEIVGSVIHQAVALTEAPRNAAKQAVSDGLRSAGTAIHDRTVGPGSDAPTGEIEGNGHGHAVDPTA